MKKICIYLKTMEVPEAESASLISKCTVAGMVMFPTAEGYLANSPLDTDISGVMVLGSLPGPESDTGRSEESMVVSRTVSKATYSFSQSLQVRIIALTASNKNAA